MTRPMHPFDARPRNVVMFMDHFFGRVPYTKLGVRFGITRGRALAICERERAHFNAVGGVLDDYLARRGYESQAQVEFYFRQWEADQHTKLIKEKST